MSADELPAAMWEDDEPEICGTCPDRVPAIIPPEGWVCPECDADWSMADDDAIAKATGEAS
jgi:hypothetical protein